VADFPPIYDFHMHTLYSDGVLLPVELARRAIVNGYRALAMTDHVGPGNCEEVVRKLVVDCEVCRRHTGLLAIPGVELTHVPPAAIASLARQAKQAGARIVVVHGETLAEPVEPGTNRAALESPDVDLLAHPGLISADEAKLAAERGIFLEISCRQGHSLSNGHVARMASQAGARLLVNTDSHSPSDLLKPGWARQVALGAGLAEAEVEQILQRHPVLLIEKLGFSL